MGLNSKKPYLENKTRKIIVPYLIDNTNILLQKKFFDYLMNFVVIGRTNVYIDNCNNKIYVYENEELPDRNFKGIFLRIKLISNKTGKEVEIQDYDIITGYKPNLTRKFKFKNILNIEQNSKSVSIKEYGDYGKIKEMQQLLNDIFFQNKLIKNYFKESKDLLIDDSSLKSNLLLSRETIFNWIYKGIDNDIFPVLNKISLSLLKGSIKNGYISKAKHQFNLRWSLIYYFKEGKRMAEILNEVNEVLRKKINSKEYDPIENDEQYYFSVGQVVAFLLSKYRGKNKPFSLAKPIVNSKNNEIIKENLRKMYNKYSYDPSINIKRFKNFYVMISGYIPEGKVNQDMIIAGFLSNSLVYEKDKEENK